ncbi:unnamed protein product [Clonostachys byssicola]|uniref:Uncharacterized protein n=1 Tax=Clonostachys byssicola TaxID=160290 RepID=A0A9N9V0E3_9HYPO|nr:unnamed protein product [Clonostachys byssicola]
MCFEDAFGDLPQFSVLWSDAMVALSQYDHDVSSVIELAGEVHMIRASGPSELEKQRTRLQNLAHKQMEICAGQMRYYCKEKTWASGPIACALVLMAVHVSLQTQRKIDHGLLLLFATALFASIADHPQSVLDKYFDPVASLMPIVSGFVDETFKRGSDLSPFDEDLSADQLDRMFDWLAETINHPSTQLNAEQKVKGLGIMCEASSLQMRLLQCFLQLSKTSESNYQLLASYSYWVLISISQLLRHDSWKSLQCDLPIMAPDQLHEYALENVGCITTIINRTGLLNGVIVPLLFSMGLEMVSYEDRRRVLDILEEQQAQNFPLSGVFRRALLDAYAGLAVRRYTTVFIRLDTID